MSSSSDAGAPGSSILWLAAYRHWPVSCSVRRSVSGEAMAGLASRLGAVDSAFGGTFGGSSQDRTQNRHLHPPAEILCGANLGARN